MLASAEDALGYQKSINGDEKTAEYYLLNYDSELKKYHEAKKEYIDRKEKDDNFGGGKCGVGNPTERAALKGMEFDKTYDGYRWLKAVEIIQRGLGERKNIFIRVRREAERNNLYTIGRGRKGWVVYVQTRYAEELERRFIIPEAWVAENTLKNWWRGIINNTAKVSTKIFIQLINS